MRSPDKDSATARLMQDLWEPGSTGVFLDPARSAGHHEGGAILTREYMQKHLIAGTCALWAAMAAQSQTPARTESKPAGLGKADAASNEEVNIRAYIELLRTDLKKSKSQILGEVMQLDTDEATRFWPVYKEFETEYAALGEGIVAVLRKYADTYRNMTDSVADELANRVLSFEQQRNALKKKYYDRVKGGLGAMTAMRFLQVENQLERIVDLQIAAQLPVIGDR